MAKTEQQLMDERKRTLEEIKKRGGKDKAKNYTSRLDSIDAELNAMRKGPSAPSPAAPPPAPEPAPTQTMPGAKSKPIRPGKMGISKDGSINPGQAGNLIGDVTREDTNLNFKLNNPESQVDIWGNKRGISVDPVTGEVSIVDSGGAPLQSTKDAFLGSLGHFQQKGPLDLSGAPKILQTGDVRNEWKTAADSNYNYMTRDLAQNESREMEATKQRLMEQGIPYSDDPNSRFQKEIRDVGRKYQNIRDEANQQSIMLGNQTMTSNLQGQSLARDAFVQGATAEHQSGLQDMQALGGMMGQFQPNFTQYAGGQQNLAGNLLNLINTVSDADLAKYGIDQDMKIKLQQLAQSQKKGGGGGGGGQDISIGGPAW